MGKQAVDGVLVPGPGPLRGGAQAQVFLDAEIGDDAAALRHHGNAAPGRIVGSGPAQHLTADAQGTAAQRGHAQQGVDQRGLADAVAADEGHPLAGFDAQVEVVQDMGRAVAGVHVFETQQAHAALPR